MMIDDWVVDERKVEIIGINEGQSKVSDGHLGRISMSTERVMVS